MHCCQKTSGVQGLWENTVLMLINQTLCLEENASFSAKDVPFWMLLFFFKRNSLLLCSYTHGHNRVGQNRLTRYQTTNFRLFQTERVCRQQFHI